MAEVDNKIHGQQVRERIKNEIVKYFIAHGYAPTFREIGESVGLKSSSSVQCHINKMLEEGTLETDAPLGTPRAIRVPDYSFKENEYERLKGYAYYGKPLYIKKE